MNSQEDPAKLYERLGVLETKLDHISNSFVDFKHGIGERVEKHGNSLAVMESELYVVKKIAWGVVISILGFVAVAVLKLVIK